MKNGLYWQGDVQDGMEESISGGRRKKYARPTINSYMYGNAKALSCIGILSGDEGMAMKYGMRADTSITISAKSEHACKHSSSSFKLCN